MSKDDKALIKNLTEAWTKDKFFSHMEEGGMGLKEITQRLIRVIDQTQDTRASLAAIKFAYSIAGLEGQADKNELNVFIGKLETLNYNQMNQMIIQGQEQARLDEYDKINLTTLEEKKEKDETAT